MAQSNSLIARDSPAGPSKRALWGLYSVYICIGIVYGFFAANISGPLICHYYFGPYGQPEGTDAAQCTLARSLFNFSWNLKFFLALIIDNYKIMGSRKRWWVIGGWAIALGLLALSAVLVPSFHAGNHHKTFSYYTFIMTGMNVALAFADVAADGMGVAYTKLEPEDQRGGVIATNYQCRFIATMLSAGGVKLFLMGGKQFVDPTNPDPMFPFGVDLAWVHWTLLILALPFFACMVMWVEDPPLAAEDEHSTGCKGVVETLSVMWKATQNYAVFSLVVYCIGISSIGQMINPADQAASDIASPDALQLSLGTMGSYALLMWGLQLYKRYFLNSNKRFLTIWTYCTAAVLQLLELGIIYKGLEMSKKAVGWFYIIQSDMPSLMQAISFCLVQITVAEFAPAGMEASLYEFLLTAANISITIGDISTTMMQGWLDLGNLSGEMFRTAFENDKAQYHHYQTNMTIGVLATCAASVVVTFIFSMCMPKNPEQCRDWGSRAAWQVPSVSMANFGIVSFMIVWSLWKVMTSLLDLDTHWNDMLNNVAAGLLAVYAIIGVGMCVANGSSSEKVSPQKDVA